MPVRLISQEELPGPLKGYRLIERLGRGGFGEVWKAEAPGGLLKAVKFVFGNLDELDEDSRPAEQEAKALERVKGIRHPYILSLEQFRVIEGQLIIVMELADRNLWDRFRECRGQGLPGIPRDELLRYLEETAEALDLMNNYYQIQHLDVKPQNLFLVFNHIKVGDFGLAKVLEGVKATVTGGVTPVYAAPETFEGWVSRFSDQYSLAIVFQELLTGARPFNGTNTRQLLMQHINGSPDLTTLPARDREAVGRALSKNPDARWPSCTELVRALKAATPASVGAPAPSGTPRPVPGAGMPTMMGLPSAPMAADSLQATRMAGATGPAPSGVQTGMPIRRERTPAPAGLPPLIKPGQGAGTVSPMIPVTPGSGPRLVTPSTVSASNPVQTLHRPAVLQTARMGSLGIAPPEKNGDGVLFPALIVALGYTGRRVAEELKRAIADRFSSTERTPNVRIICVDTDPEAVSASLAPDDPSALTPREIVAARLNRSTHYLQRDSLPPVEQWLPPGALYKLPRNPGPADGVRAFGRLALFDHYRPVAQRIRQEIETFLTDDTLLQADKATKLGLRTNRPRVYIAAGLAGGTGGGMFLDVAFLVRHELRQVGYLRPDVVGVFFVPPADAHTPRSNALGNTYAALAELHHFQSKKSPYQTVFDKSEAPISDSEPPFSRVALLQLPKSPDQARSAAAVAARALYHEMLSPVGRAADEAREAYGNAHPATAPSCQTFGLFRLSWPRPEVLVAATNRMALRQFQDWVARDVDHLREPVAEWLERQWVERNLSFEAVAEAFNTAARVALREAPERVFDALVDPLRTRTPSGGWLDPDSACDVLEQLVKIVGRPAGDEAVGSLAPALDACSETLVKEAEGHIAVMAATFIEVPRRRLAGAEEAVRQIAEKLKRQVNTLESLRVDLDKEVSTMYTRLINSIGSLASSGLLPAVTRKSNAHEALELLRAYPRKRLLLHALDRALPVFHRLLANAPEYLRDINFCRATLTEMHAALAKAQWSPPVVTGLGKLILPDGCESLDDAADKFLAGLDSEDLLAFEQSLQKAITRKFRGLGHVCLKPGEKGPAVRELVLVKARDFLDTKLDHADPATVLFRTRKQCGSAETLLCEAFGQAAPNLMPAAGARPYEMVILGAPETEDGKRVLELVRSELPNLELATATLPDGICFSREYPQVLLTDLPQLAGHARDAYLLMGADHPPHTRTDVTWAPPSNL